MSLGKYDLVRKKNSPFLATRRGEGPVRRGPYETKIQAFSPSRVIKTVSLNGFLEGEDFARKGVGEEGGGFDKKGGSFSLSLLENRGERRCGKEVCGLGQFVCSKRPKGGCWESQTHQVYA